MISNSYVEPIGPNFGSNVSPLLSYAVVYNTTLVLAIGTSPTLSISTQLKFIKIVTKLTIVL